MRGLIDENTKYDQYKIQNSGQKYSDDTTLIAELTDAFSKATGIDDIKVQIIEIPNFVDTVEEGTNWSLILTIALFVIILALLICVVFRVSKPEEVIETEPELSVEKLLATTKENQSLDDIDFGETSEMKNLIERFVDENPEAVAALLRNWLNDEWD